MRVRAPPPAPVIAAEFGDGGGRSDAHRGSGGRYPGAYSFRRAETARLLRVDEAAGMLAIIARHLRELVARAEVRVVRLGRCVRIPRSEVARLCGDDVDMGPALATRSR